MSVEAVEIPLDIISAEVRFQTAMVHLDIARDILSIDGEDFAEFLEHAADKWRDAEDSEPDMDIAAEMPAGTA